MATWWFVFVYTLFVVCCSLRAVCCVLRAVCCSLFVVQPCNLFWRRVLFTGSVELREWHRTVLTTPFSRYEYGR